MNDTIPAMVAASVREWPHRVAVEDNEGSVTYAELDALAARAAHELARLGVQHGDRVGICMRKTIDAVAAIVGALRLGASYVPVDPAAPPARAAYILSDCAVRALVIEERISGKLLEALQSTGHQTAIVPLPTVGGGAGIKATCPAVDSAEPSISASISPDDLAYILYTSGSTGRPKGVMLSHRNAMSFVHWCSSVFAPTPDDRFSSHAPLHFDLSILDLYVPLNHGARVVLIDADSGKEPVGLATLIAERGITVWYSTPSILSLLAQYGKMERHEYSALRTVLFAGEVFPVKHLRAVQQFWPKPRYYNLYGPTETNVCTYYEVEGMVPESRIEPYPIGKTCWHVRSRVVDEHGNDVPGGREGELVINGDGVMQGYWNLPDRTATAFLIDEAGDSWYHTGDIVIKSECGDYIYVGRRDRMVKRRGYRIELGEIEAGLYSHPAIKEAAVVAVRDQQDAVVIKAFVACREGQRPSVIELKRFCAEALPIYMVPDTFGIKDLLPKTSTDKIDYQKLLEIA